MGLFAWLAAQAQQAGAKKVNVVALDTTLSLANMPNANTIAKMAIKNATKVTKETGKSVVDSKTAVKAAKKDHSTNRRAHHNANVQLIHVQTTAKALGINPQVPVKPKATPKRKSDNGSANQA